jgi:hypothetical protein
MEFVKVVVTSKNHLEAKDRKKIIERLNRDVSYPWGIKFEVGVPRIEVGEHPNLSNELTERFLDILHGI